MRRVRQRNPLSTGAKVALGVTGLVAGGGLLYALTREEKVVPKAKPTRERERPSGGREMPSVGLEGAPQLPVGYELYRYIDYPIVIAKKTPELLEVPIYGWSVFTPGSSTSKILAMILAYERGEDPDISQYSGVTLIKEGRAATIEAARAAAKALVDEVNIPEPTQPGFEPDPEQPPGLPEKWYFVGGGWNWPDKNRWPTQKSIAAELIDLGYHIPSSINAPDYNMAVDQPTRAAVREFQIHWNAVANPLVWGTYLVGVPGDTAGRPTGALARDGLIGSSTWKALRWVFLRERASKTPSWSQLVELGKVHA